MWIKYKKIAYIKTRVKKKHTHRRKQRMRSEKGQA